MGHDRAKHGLWIVPVPGDVLDMVARSNASVRGGRRSDCLMKATGMRMVAAMRTDPHALPVAVESAVAPWN